MRVNDYPFILEPAPRAVGTGRFACEPDFWQPLPRSAATPAAATIFLQFIVIDFTIIE